MHWDDVADCKHETFIIATVPNRFAKVSYPVAGINYALGHVTDC